jgi:CBS domain containing-hemolysin-like protein
MIFDLLPWLAAMAALLAASAFFSASEAALFSLRWQDRRTMLDGAGPQQVAANLLADPDRLLSAVLFWNLTVNMAYFALTSVAAIRLQDKWEQSGASSAAFGFAALLVVIVCGEMLPKTLGVAASLRVSTMVALPLAALVRVVDPLMPVLRGAMLLSRRLIWPRFQTEPYLEISDLERAIALSTDDAQLVDQEQSALHSIVLLSEIRAEELMRPRTQFRSFRPPISLADLEERAPASGYLLVTEVDSEEIAGAIRLDNLFDPPEEHLERLAEPVLFLPWCVTAATALEKLCRRELDAAAVVNEYGETIGVLTIDDILDTVLTAGGYEAGGPPGRRALEEVEPGRWLVTGATPLRRLQRHFQVEIPPTRNVTVAGVVQEALQKMPEEQDESDWGPFHFTVLKTPQRGRMLLELRLREEGAEEKGAETP